MKLMKKFLCLLLAGLLALPPVAYSAFDPVNDDTDLFLVNPNAPATRPNVLIVLDNTANWNIPFANEKSALVNTINNLDERFNVGLMMMPQTGTPNDNIDGGYVHFHVRQMTPENKGALSGMVSGLQQGPASTGGDQGNNATHGLALYEAYLYYAGLPSRAGYGKIKTDNPGNPLVKGLQGHALNALSAAEPYNSPVSDGCAKNFVILISNGQANENAAARAELQGYLTQLRGSTPSIIALSPNGQQGNWSDEMADFMANNDVNTNVPLTQNVITYVVEVNPQTTGQGPDMTALMKSTATKGKGRYFGVSSDSGGAAIADALNSIFTEVLAENSVFAATTLPVSVNVRGTNLDQVYIGVFRPDASRQPRWLGNLKMYRLGADAVTGELGLRDANNQSAVDTSTGFIAKNATSFWTTPGASPGFWAFRTAEQNGVGGPFDSPDGDLVEKGGAAQKIRTVFPNAEASSPRRSLYTCTTGGFTEQCDAAGKRLALTPFDTNNVDITEAALALDARLIAALTGFETKAVSALGDRLSATLNNLAMQVDVASLNNGSTTRGVTNLSTAVTRNVESLTALGTGPQSAGVSSVVRVGGNTYRVTLSLTTLPTGFTSGTSVTLAGVTGNTNLNGTFTIESPSSNMFNISCPGCGNTSGTGGTATVSVPADTSIATATVTAHGFTSGNQITIAGASPSQFNGTFGITVTGPNTFTYPLPSPAGAATVASGFTNITASGTSTVATATTTAPHGWSVGQSVTIYGASLAGYNGTKTITSVPSTTSFTYNVGTPLTPNTNPNVFAIQGGTTNVTATTAAVHGFAVGNFINLAGSAISEYNGTFQVTSVSGDSLQFTFSTPTVLPNDTSGNVKASSGTTTTVTVTTTTRHGFAAGNAIAVASTSTPADANHPGSYTIASVPSDFTFTYVTGAALPAPVGSFTVRPALGGKAWATVAGHGYSTGNEVFIEGASPNGYNGGPKTVTVLDANTFTYALTTAIGPNTGNTVTSSVKTTTARATSVAHGFTTGGVVNISGATPADFNGTVTVTVVDGNNFTYPIPTGVPQGDASGAIIAQQGGSFSAERTSLIRWARGEDNFEDENQNGSATDIRASVHGDVLHSRPAVINYNRTANSNDDVFVFYGSNDGIFRAVKGGFNPDPASPGLVPGQEAWGFIPPEFFGSLKRLRNNSPKISSTFKRPYFADGSIGVFAFDGNSDGILNNAAGGDIANLYISMRRGGRFIYALDVLDPSDPKFLWKVDNTAAGFSELGQTWSQPVVVRVNPSVGGLGGINVPVVIFAAGYDPAVEDIDPADVASSTATGVTTVGGLTVNRTMGRGIYVVNANTGQLLWRAVRTGDPSTDTVTTARVDGLDYAIPSDVTVVRNTSGGPTSRVYVGDTGGNVWRIDFDGSGGTDLSGTTVTKLASISDQSTAGGRRKILYPPEVVRDESGTFDAVLFGTGDREHPFESTIQNRFYMVKDTGKDAGPVYGTATAPTIVTGDLVNLTNNCIQECTDSTQQSAALTALANSKGWYLDFEAAEKVVGAPLAVAGDVFFGTNLPPGAPSGDTCAALGPARLYQISITDATAVVDNAQPAGLTAADRYDVVGTGFLPSPQYVVSEDKKDTVLTGPIATKPKSVSLGARLRKFWYKEIDQP